MTMNTLPTVNSTHHLSAEQENIQKQEEAQQEVWALWIDGDSDPLLCWVIYDAVVEAGFMRHHWWIRRLTVLDVHQNDFEIGL